MMHTHQDTDYSIVCDFHATKAFNIDKLAGEL